MAIGPIGKLLVARTMRWPRFAVLAVGALVALGALAFAGSPDEIGSWAFGDEVECFAAASVTLFVTVPGLSPVGSVPELVVAAAPAPPVACDAPRAPPVA